MSNYQRYFKEAYQKFLLEKDFDISNEVFDGIQKWKDVETSADTLSSLQDVGEDNDIQTLDLVDPEAWTEKEVEDKEANNDYLGEVVLECVSCHNHITVDPNKVYEDAETGTCCTDIQCPICNSDQGYTVLGKLEKFEAPEEEEEDKLEFPKEEEEEDEVDVEETEEVKESLHDRIRRKHLQENKVEEACAKDEGLLDFENNLLDGVNKVKDALDPTKEGFDPISGIKDGVDKVFGNDQEDIEVDEALDESKVCEKCGKNPCVCEGCEKDEALTEGEDCAECDEACEKDEALDEGKDCAECDEACEKDESLEESAIKKLAETYGEFDNLDEAEEDKLVVPGDVEIAKKLAAKDEALTEALNNLSLDTDEQHLEVSADETGRISVVAEPTGAPAEEIPDTMVPGEESIVPLDFEDMDNIESNIAPEEQDEILGAEEEQTPVNVEEPLEEPLEGEEEFGEEDFENLENESFDYLGNTFMKKLYENVSSYQTTNAYEDNDKLFVEGVITFNSGKQKNTKFIFENAEETKTGRIVLEGLNETFFPTKAFKLRGKLKDKAFYCESLRYNYSINKLNESTGQAEPTKVFGIIRTK